MDVVFAGGLAGERTRAGARALTGRRRGEDRAVREGAAVAVRAGGKGGH